MTKIDYNDKGNKIKACFKGILLLIKGLYEDKVELFFIKR